MKLLDPRMYNQMKKNFIILLFTIIVVNQGYTTSMEIEEIDQTLEANLQNIKVGTFTTHQDHIEFLKSAISNAKQTLIIISPYISSNNIQTSTIANYIKDAIDRGKEIVVYTDSNFDIQNGTLKTNAQHGRQILVTAGAELRIVKNIHSKNIIIDDEYLTIGSFNWLSAVSDSTSPYCRYETTTLMTGGNTKEHINKILHDLGTLPVIDPRGYQVFFQEMKPALRERYFSSERLQAAINLYRKYSSNSDFKDKALEILLSHANFPQSILKMLVLVNSDNYESSPIIKGLIKNCYAVSDFLCLVENIATTNQCYAITIIKEYIIPHIYSKAYMYDYEEIINIHDTIYLLGLDNTDTLSNEVKKAYNPYRGPLPEIKPIYMQLPKSLNNFFTCQTLAR